MFWRELTIIGARVYVRDDFLRAVDLLNSGQIPAEALISRIVPLAQVADAFATFDAGGVMKVLIDCAAGAPMPERGPFDLSGQLPQIAERSSSPLRC